MADSSRAVMGFDKNVFSTGFLTLKASGHSSKSYCWPWPNGGNDSHLEGAPEAKHQIGALPDVGERGTRTILGNGTTD
jgi:hypothetical protein